MTTDENTLAIGPLKELVRRDRVQPGDEILTSHHGIKQITEVIPAGIDGRLTQLIWAKTSDDPNEPRGEVDLSENLVVLFSQGC